MTYLNLTAGLEWSRHTPLTYRGHGYVRLQSTLLEQKHYDAFILSVPADMLFRLAREEQVFILDASTHERGSRACWQGLEFLRFVCGRTWGFWVDVPKGLYPDFEERWKRLGRPAKNWVKYYRPVWCGAPIRLGWRCLHVERERSLRELLPFPPKIQETNKAWWYARALDDFIKGDLVCLKYIIGGAYNQLWRVAAQRVVHGTCNTSCFGVALGDVAKGDFAYFAVRGRTSG